MRKCTNTEWYVIINFVRIGRDLRILDEFRLNFFLSWHKIWKIRSIHEASSLRKPKSSNILPHRKNFVKSVMKQYGNSDSHPFSLRNNFEKLLKNRVFVRLTLKMSYVPIFMVIFVFSTSNYVFLHVISTKSGVCAFRKFIRFFSTLHVYYTCPIFHHITHD